MLLGPLEGLDRRSASWKIRSISACQYTVYVRTYEEVQQPDCFTGSEGGLLRTFSMHAQLCSFLFVGPDMIW